MNRDDATRHPVEALSALIDGELDGDERRALEAHLAACAGCHDLADDLKTLDRAVADEAVPATPPDLARRIAAALPERASAAPPLPAVAPRSWFRAPMPLAAAASLAVATLLWLAWPGGRPAPEPPADAVTQATSAPASSAPATPSSPAGAADAPRGNPGPEAPAETPAAPMKADDKDAGSGSATTPRREKRSQAPAAQDEAFRAQRKESTPVSQDVRGDADFPDGVAKNAPAEPPATPPGGGVSGRPAEAKDKQALALQRQERTPEADSLSVMGRNYQEVLTLAPGVSDAQGRPSLPALRAEPYAVRLLPGDAMRVESGAYACTVELSPEDMRLLLGQYAAVRPNAQAPASGVDKVAAAPPPAATRPAAAGEVHGIAANPAVTEAKVLTIEATPEGRALILLLVRERYRAALEERCGPLPR